MTPAEVVVQDGVDRRALSAELQTQAPDDRRRRRREFSQWLREGGVWRIAEAGTEPVSVMILDIRRGRLPELCMAVANALCADCIEILGLRADRLNVEFTQHDGDEMFHPALGGFSPDWTTGEQSASLESPS